MQYNPPDGQPRRDFTPSRTVRYGWQTFSPSKLVKYSPKYGYSRLFNFPYHGAPFVPLMNTIVVQIHGIAVPNDGSDPEGAAAGGVCFGIDSPHNLSFALSKETAKTNTRAYLEATIRALDQIVKMRQAEVLDPRWKELIIMTNSEYLKRALSEWVWTWERNGWTRMRMEGQEVKHAKTIERLQHLMVLLETTMHVAVRFWKVETEDVAGAVALAKVSLRQ